MIEQKDLTERFDSLEKKLELLALANSATSYAAPSISRDEIDLRELFSVLWLGKWWILGITVLFTVASVIYAKSLPNLYKAEGVYAPAQKSSGVSGLAAQYGGLAAMAGINLGGGESSDIDQAIPLLKSWPFIESFINKYDIKPYIFGVKKWDAVNDLIVWNDSVYSPELKQWLRKPASNGAVEPTSYEAYQAFVKLLTVSSDAKTGLITISIEYAVPELSTKWVDLLVAELNSYFQQRDMQEAKRNIDYLTDKISQTSIAEMQSVFYGMIESQTKTLMLAEVGEQYLAKTVIAPKVAEQKSKPKRSLIIIMGALLGGFVAVFIVFVRYFIAISNSK